MDSTIVKIGRAETNDIRISEDYGTVSNEHAYIQLNNGVLTFVDHSSNGTMVNGVKYKGQSVTIKKGDDISLAGKYLLPWDEILAHFPQLRRSTTLLEEETPEVAAPRKTMSVEQMFGNEKPADNAEEETAVDTGMHGRKTVSQNPVVEDGHRPTSPYGGGVIPASGTPQNQVVSSPTEKKQTIIQRFKHWQSQQDPTIFWGGTAAIAFLFVYVIILFNDIIYNII